MAPVFYAGSITLGIALGAVFVISWRVFVPKGAISRIVAELASIASGMARADEVDDFLNLYKRLFVNVGAYLARNFAGLAFACLPMVLVWTLLVPPILEAWGSQADAFAIYPELEGLAIAKSRDNQTEDQTGARLALLVGGSQVSRYTPHGRLAICWSQAYCTLFELLGFEVEEHSNAPVAGTSFIVIRPEHNDENLLWPYLSDLEFAFLLAFVLATPGALVLHGRRR